MCLKNDKEEEPRRLGGDREPQGGILGGRCPTEHDCRGENLEIVKILEDLDLCEDDECPWKEEERKVKQGLKRHKGGYILE